MNEELLRLLQQLLSTPGAMDSAVASIPGYRRDYADEAFREGAAAIRSAEDDKLRWAVRDKAYREGIPSNRGNPTPEELSRSSEIVGLPDDAIKLIMSLLR